MKKQNFLIVENIRNTKVSNYLLPKRSSFDGLFDSSITGELELIPIYRTPITDTMTGSGIMIYLMHDNPDNPRFVVAEYERFSIPTLLLKKEISLNEVGQYISNDNHFGFSEAYNHYRIAQKQSPLHLFFQVGYEKQKLFVPGNYAKAGEVMCGDRWFDLFGLDAKPFYVTKLFEGHHRLDGLIYITYHIYKEFERDNFIISEKNYYDVIQKISISSTIKNLEWAINGYMYVDLNGIAKRTVFDSKEVEKMYSSSITG